MAVVVLLIPKSISETSKCEPPGFPPANYEPEDGMTIAGRKLHHLFHRELSDAPGRNEVWDEYLVYRENGRWTLIAEGTDFSGLDKAPTVKELFSTTALVKWVLERDYEIEGELSRRSDSENEAREVEERRKFGPYASRLHEISSAVNAGYCLSCLDAWLSERWPKAKKLPHIRVLEVKGAVKRGVWIRIYRPAYDVETNLGPAYLSPPTENGCAQVQLKADSSLNGGRTIRLNQRILNRLAELRPAFEEVRLSIEDFQIRKAKDR